MINVVVKFYHNRLLPVCYYVVQSPTLVKFEKALNLWRLKTRVKTHINVKLT